MSTTLMKKKKKRKVVFFESDEECTSKERRIEEVSDRDEEDEEEEDDDEEDEAGEEGEEEEEDGEEEEEEEGEDDASSSSSSSEEEDEEISKRETVRKLLEPFGKDQLIDILKEAALKDPSIIERINQTAESNPTHRKIFVHGLGWDVTDETLTSAFKQYGQIEECRVVTDKVTGKSKTYGFILFKTREGALKALKKPQKKIGKLMTSCQLASQGPVPEATGSKLQCQISVDENKETKHQGGEKLVGSSVSGVLQPNTGSGVLQPNSGWGVLGPNAGSGVLPPIFGSGVLPPNSGAGVFHPNSVAGGFHPNNIVYSSYAMGYPGFVSQGFPPPGAVLMGQNQGLGVLYPAAFGSSMNHLGLSPSVGSVLSPAVNRNATTPAFGLGQ